MCDSTASKSVNKNYQQPIYLPATWNNQIKNDNYKFHLENKLFSIPFLDSSLVSNTQKYKTTWMIVNDIIIESAKDAGCVKNNHFKPRPYWCPQLSFMRDKKRFWWSLWVDNGRPRNGPVFYCYEGVKKLFRQISRQCADNLLNVNNYQFNTLFNHRKLTAFWNCVKISRKNKAIKSNLQVDTLSRFLKLL